MLRKLSAIFVAGAWTALLFPFTCLAMLLTLSTDVSLWICRKLWSPPLLWTGGAQLSVQGLEHVDARRPTLYVANHQSTLDIPALFVALPVDLRFIAKKELSYVPFLGWYLRLARFVFVDRSNHARAVQSLDEAAQRIQGAGLSLVVYPEGTRSPDGRVLPFKKGPFALALKARVPICPVTVEGSGRLMPKNSWNITPGPVRVKIGAPIDTTAYGEHERERLARDVRAVIIRQSLELGGKGGDLDDAIAPPGREGVGQSHPPVQHAQPGSAA